MRFEWVTEEWLNSVPEEEMHIVCKEMERLLGDADQERPYRELEFGSPEYNFIYWKHIDLVQTMMCRFPLNLPKSEHGWYLPEDD